MFSHRPITLECQLRYVSLAESYPTDKKYHLGTEKNYYNRKLQFVCLVCIIISNIQPHKKKIKTLTKITRTGDQIHSGNSSKKYKAIHIIDIGLQEVSSQHN